MVLELVHRARWLVAAALTRRFLVAAWPSTTLTPYKRRSLRFKPAAKERCEKVAAESQGTAPRVTRESAEDAELSLWPAGGAEYLRLS